VSHPVADIFRNAARINTEDNRRRGNTVWLETPCELVVAGDLHGQRPLLARIIKHADLADHPQRILVLQELIHGELDPKSNKDRSIDLLLRAARLKVAHPEQLLFLLSNHDVAQITGREVSKDGRNLCRQFTADVISAFEGGGEEVLEAVLMFLQSQPLAVRTPGGVLIAHSIPSPAALDRIGAEILDRANHDEDLLRGGAVYEWTWGRRQEPEQIDALADQLGVEFFLLSHRPVDGSYEVISDRAVAITSENNSGCVASFDADRPLTAETFPETTTPLGLL